MKHALPQRVLALWVVEREARLALVLHLLRRCIVVFEVVVVGHGRRNGQQLSSGYQLLLDTRPDSSWLRFGTVKDWPPPRCGRENNIINPSHCAKRQGHVLI